MLTELPIRSTIKYRDFLFKEIIVVKKKWPRLSGPLNDIWYRMWTAKSYFGKKFLFKKNLMYLIYWTTFVRPEILQC